LHEIRDAVVQDANDSEGTGVWANLEAISAHIPAPSLSAAHFLRIASASVSQRHLVKESLGTPSPCAIPLEESQKLIFLEDLRKSVHVGVLACFIQGLDLLSRTSESQGWNIDIEQVVRIWRAGCIIKSDYITDLFEHHYASSPDRQPLCEEGISGEIKRCWPSLKHVVFKGLEADAHLPCLGATLEYLKYSSSMDLPTSFMEAQLDAFGAHGFELKDEKIGDMSKGKLYFNRARRLKILTPFVSGRHHSSWSML
jgi:6-phosphogluconate dehydrogenase